MRGFEFLRTAVLEITGCDLVVVKDPNGVYQHPPSQGGFIEVPEDPERPGLPEFEQVVHEVCHWVVATQAERAMENLGQPWQDEGHKPIVGELPPEMRERRELQTAWVEGLLFERWRLSHEIPPTTHRNIRRCPVDASQEAMRRATEVGLARLFELVRGRPRPLPGQVGLSGFDDNGGARERGARQAGSRDDFGANRGSRLRNA